MVSGDGNQKGGGKPFNWRTASADKAAVSAPPSLEKMATAGVCVCLFVLNAGIELKTIFISTHLIRCPIVRG